MVKLSKKFEKQVIDEYIFLLASILIDFGCCTF